MLKKPLGRAAVLLTVAQLIHDLDHVRQGRSAHVGVSVAAVLAWAATIVMLIVVARNWRLAPLYCAAFGISTAIGIAMVHGLPSWGALSDSYADAHVDALSWLLAGLPVAAAIWLAVQGVRELRVEALAETDSERAEAANAAPVG
jgi:hypothetical protein